MPPPKIMRRYGIRAEQTRGGGGFVGFYAMPGKDEQLCRSPDGAISVFDTEDEAIAEAGESLCAALNGRHMATWKRNYRRMTGAELAVALAELKISPTEFATIYGTHQARVMQWIDGEEDIPHPVLVLLSIFKLPLVLDRARDVTNENTTDKIKERT